MTELDYINVATDIKNQAAGKINKTIVEKEVEILMPILLDIFQKKVNNNQFSIQEIDSNVYLYELKTIFLNEDVLLDSINHKNIHYPRYAFKKQFTYVIEEVARIFNNVLGYEAETYVKDGNYHLDIILEAEKK